MTRLSLRAAIDAKCNSTSERIKPVSLPQDAAPEPDPTPEPETDVGALLGGVFGRGA